MNFILFLKVLNLYHNMAKGMKKCLQGRKWDAMLFPTWALLTDLCAHLPTFVWLASRGWHVKLFKSSPLQLFELLHFRLRHRMLRLMTSGNGKAQLHGQKWDRLSNYVPKCPRDRAEVGILLGSSPAWLLPFPFPSTIQ
jgi:hypothetical protein